MTETVIVIVVVIVIVICFWIIDCLIFLVVKFIYFFELVIYFF